MGMPISSGGAYSAVASQAVSVPRASTPAPSAQAKESAPKEAAELASSGSVGTRIHTTA
jgi:hypothetical protein